MIGSQYKIKLPSDYDMNMISDRVRKNGHKTDGFEDLLYKFYLVTEKGIHDNIENSYCPLYLWKDSEGLNKFLFNGFYDNILNSFGWQQVNIGIPLMNTTTSKVLENKYIFTISREIQPQESLKGFKDKIEKEIPKMDQTEYIVFYNPDKWRYEVFYFLNDLSMLNGRSGTVYSILYVSPGEAAAK